MWRRTGGACFTLRAPRADARPLPHPPPPPPAPATRSCSHPRWENELPCGRRMRCRVSALDAAYTGPAPAQPPPASAASACPVSSVAGPARCYRQIKGKPYPKSRFCRCVVWLLWRCGALPALLLPPNALRVHLCICWCKASGFWWGGVGGSVWCAMNQFDLSPSTQPVQAAVCPTPRSASMMWGPRRPAWTSSRTASIWSGELRFAGAGLASLPRVAAPAALAVPVLPQPASRCPAPAAGRRRTFRPRHWRLPALRPTSTW